MMKRAKENEVISASEISEYTYCPISWSLKRAGISPRSPELARGIRKHSEMGKNLSDLERKENASRTFRFLEYLCVLSAILLLGWFLCCHF